MPAENRSLVLFNASSAGPLLGLIPHSLLARVGATAPFAFFFSCFFFWGQTMCFFQGACQKKRKKSESFLLNLLANEKLHTCLFDGRAAKAESDHRPTGFRLWLVSRLG